MCGWWCGCCLWGSNLRTLLPRSEEEDRNEGSLLLLLLFLLFSRVVNGEINPVTVAVVGRCTTASDDDAGAGGGGSVVWGGWAFTH